MPAKQQVFIFSSVHPWNDTRIFHKQARSLAEAGYDVHVYAIVSETTYDHTIPNITVQTFHKADLLGRRKIWNQFRDIIKKHQPDYVHLHDPELMLLIRRIKRISNASVLFDMHENFPAALASKKIAGRPFPKSIIPFVRHLEQHMLQRADAVLFAEESYKQYYQNISAKKMDILNYPHQNKACNNLSKPSRPLIIYAGAIHEVRGFDEMLATATELRDRGHQFELLIIGKIPDRLEDKATCYVKQNKLENHVQLLGRMDLQQVNNYYARATVGLALLHPEPNYLGSIATKIFEYMSFGLPFVASNFPLWQEFVTTSGSGLTANPKSVTDIANQIEILLTNNEKHRELSQNGKIAHNQKYNWTHEAQKLLSLYDDLKGGQGYENSLHPSTLPTK
ncbi:glycosyltransferase family 4 protein [Listeria booriae]|uniref:Glycosyltransferase family 4 protein n=1 Tax=Listeria booriae TaxID=1552123 RepID=A0A7X0Z312_9LIST|nr:glycosyltransferase family 4 protein [Listeria booriae]MBC2175051.1 glycosyltransferase family 4 protein [Listeria booriae]